MLRRFAACVLVASCVAAPAADVPAPVWSHSVAATTFARVLDVAAAPPNAPGDAPAWVVLTDSLGAMQGPFGPGGGWLRLHGLGDDGVVRWNFDAAQGEYHPDYGRTGTFDVEALRITRDARGGTWMAGAYDGRVHFWKSQDDLPWMASKGGKDVFFAHWNADGSFDTYTDHGGPLDDRATSLTMLADGTLVLGGEFRSTIRMDTGDIVPAGGLDAFLALVIPGIGLAGLLPVGSPVDERVADVAADDDGVVASIEFREKLALSEGDANTLLGLGGDDAALAATDISGRVRWQLVAGGLGDDTAGRLARVDGATLWTLHLSRGAVVGSVRFARGGHVVVRVQDGGTVAWAHPVELAHGSRPLAIAARHDGRFVVAGDDYLGAFDADGLPRWERSGFRDLDARSVTSNDERFLVGGNGAGPLPFVTPALAPADDAVQGVLALFE